MKLPTVTVQFSWCLWELKKSKIKLTLATTAQIHANYTSVLFGLKMIFLVC